MKYTIELKNKKEKDAFITLLNSGVAAYCNVPKSIQKIYDNIMTQLESNTNNIKEVSINEMRNLCDIVWGWQAKDWDDKKVKEMYTLYKQGYFNLF